MKISNMEAEKLPIFLIDNMIERSLGIFNKEFLNKNISGLGRCLFRVLFKNGAEGWVLREL